MTTSFPKWEFILTDRFGNVLGELNDAKERIVKRPLGRVDNGSFVVDISNPWVNRLRELDQTLVKIYRNKKLQCLGPIVTTQKTRAVGTNTMVCNWAGVGWRLGTRLIEESKTAEGIEYGTPLVPIDAGQIAVKIIEGLNKAPLIPAAAVGLKAPFNVVNPAPEAIAKSTSPLPQGDTGIRIGTVEACPATSVGPWYYQNALQAISLLASTFSGFDWEIKPVEPFKDSTGIVLGMFNAAPGHSNPEDSFGEYRENTWFEYGDGKNNVSEWTELLDATGLLNRAYSTPGIGGAPKTEEEEAIQQYDWVGIETRGTVYDDVIPSNIISNPLRNALLQAQVTVRRAPKSVITFKPTADPEEGVTPQYEKDFDLGDLVNFRSVEYGVETFNGVCRIYELEFQVDENGNELVTPILIEQEV